MENSYVPEQLTTCKKCGEQHRIEKYRELKYYLCPNVNRVLLLTEEKDK